MSVLAILPVWAIIYWQTIQVSEAQATGPLAVGEEVYGRFCASCHGVAGGGGVGHALVDGELITTFPEIDAQLEWIRGGTAGIGEGNPYGDGNNRIAGEQGTMPAFGGQLPEDEIYAVARYERESLSGEEIDEAELLARDELYAELTGETGEAE